MIKNPRTFVTMLAVISVALVIGLPEASAGGIPVETADYIFDLNNGRGGAPDPAVWPTQASGIVPTQGVDGLGWAMADPDNGSQLEYSHLISSLSADPTSPDFKNTASCRAKAITSPLPDPAGAWSDHAIGWRLILDDGRQRVELALARDPGTMARQVRLQDAPNAPPIPFGWDNDFPNVYEIARTTTGDFVVTVTNGDPNAPNRVQSQTYAAGQTAGSSGVARFAWGMGLDGGGSAYWQEAHGRVFASILSVTIDIKPGSFPNSINLNSSGVIPVAILSTPTFDAPARVDPATVRLAGASVNMVGKSDRYLCHAEDVNADGLPDLVCQVVTAQFMIELGDSEAMLEAQTFDGVHLQGRDSVRIVPN